MIEEVILTLQRRITPRGNCYNVGREVEDWNDQEIYQDYLLLNVTKVLPLLGVGDPHYEHYAKKNKIQDI